MGIYKTKFSPFSKSLQWVLKQNLDTKLDEGGSNEVSALSLKNALILLENLNIDNLRNTYNIMLNAFKIAINGSLSFFNLINSFIDEFEDESGIDTINSINELYDSTDDYYTPTGGDEIKLLLPLDGIDGATSTTDESLSEHAITFNGSAQLDTDYKKFGTSSLLLEGTGSFLSMPNSDDFDIVIDNVQYQTISMWIRPLDLSGDRPFFAFYSGVNDWWSFYHSDTVGLHFVVRTAGVSQIVVYDITSFGSLTVNNWHHIALIIKGTGTTKDIGIYVDGVQVVYGQSSFTHNFGASTAYIGSTVGGASGNYLGHIDDVVLINGNPFNASPNVGKTDTIVVPTSPYIIEKNDMTLISDDISAEELPNTVYVAILKEDVNENIINVDYNFYISRDGGTSYTKANLELEGNYNSNIKIYTALIDISGQPEGTILKWKIETLNQKDSKTHAVGLTWA